MTSDGSISRSSSNNASPQQQVVFATVPSDAGEIMSNLSKAFDLLDHRHNAHSAIILEYLADIVAICIQQGLDCQQIDDMVRIAQQLLEMCAKHRTRDEVQQLLHGSLLQMCSANSTGITSEDNHAAVPRLQPQSLADLASCFSQGLLQHYNLYSLCLTRQQQHEQHRHDLVVESAAQPPALELSLPEHEWQAHLAAEQAQRQQEQAAAEAAEQSRRQAEEAARIAHEQAAEAAMRQEQLLRKPKTLDEAVDKLVAQRLEDVRAALADVYSLKTAALATKIAQLEQQATTCAAALVNEQGRAGSAAKEPRAGSARTGTHAGNA